MPEIKKKSIVYKKKRIVLHTSLGQLEASEISVDLGSPVVAWLLCRSLRLKGTEFSCLSSLGSSLVLLAVSVVLPLLLALLLPFPLPLPKPLPLFLCRPPPWPLSAVTLGAPPTISWVSSSWSIPASSSVLCKSACKFLTLASRKCSYLVVISLLVFYYELCVTNHDDYLYPKRP
jgi:hypothetical protein